MCSGAVVKGCDVQWRSGEGVGCSGEGVWCAAVQWCGVWCSGEGCGAVVKGCGVQRCSGEGVWCAAGKGCGEVVWCAVVKGVVCTAGGIHQSRTFPKLLCS